MTIIDYYPTPPHPLRRRPILARMTMRKIEKKYFIVLVWVWVLVLGCVLLTPKPEPQTCEADYYRGVYSLCMVLNAEMAKKGSTNLVACDILVKEAIGLGWYERAAPGFEWPRENISGMSARY